MSEIPNPSESNGLASSASRHLPLHSETSPSRRFPEGKIYLGVIIGFFTCENLTNTWLPALGLTTLAHQYEGIADLIAPYLLLPVCVVVSILTLRRSLASGLLTIVGSMILDYYFFIRYNVWLSRSGLLIIGLGVLWSYFLYRSGKPLFLPPSASSSTDRLRRWSLLAVTYTLSVLFVVSLGPLSRYVHLAGSFGRDLGAATATLPTLLVLLVYLLSTRFSFLRA
jgi:hypothetical protein